MKKTAILIPPTKVKRQYIKQGYLDKIAGFIKPDGLLSVTPMLIISGCFALCFTASASDMSPTARTGVQRYDSRVSARQSSRASYNTPPSQRYDNRGSSVGQSNVYRGVVPYRTSPSSPGSAYRGSYYGPVTGSLPQQTYPKTPTGLNLSSYPQRTYQLPYITRDETGIRSGMPEFDRYRSNQIIAETYSDNANLRPFT
jgi:hypothetical protein